MSVMLRFCDTAGMPSRHAPPAVRHPLKPSRTVAACLCALWLLAAMLLLAWALNLQAGWWPAAVAVAVCLVAAAGMRRSEEHTSELQSPCNLVCRLLLEKKKKRQHNAILLASC